MSEELGSVGVTVRADLGPLERGFDSGESRARKFEKTVSESANRATQSLDALGNRGAQAAANTVAGAEEGASAFTKLSESATIASGAIAVLPGPTGRAIASVTRLSSSVKILGAELALGVLGLSAWVAVQGLAIRESEKFNALQRTTEAFLKSTGYAAGVTAGQIREIADELSGETLFPTEEIVRAAQALLNFRSISGPTFKETVRVATDMAAVFGSVETAAVQVGRAMQDPINQAMMLNRATAGVIRSQLEEAKRLAEAGQHAEAQRVILAALAAQYGGIGGSQQAGLTGAINQASDAYGDFMERLGNRSPITYAIESMAMLTKAMLDTAGASFFPKDLERLKQVQGELAELRGQMKGNENLIKYDANVGELARRIALLEEEEKALRARVSASDASAEATQKETDRLKGLAAAEEESQRAMDRLREQEGAAKSARASAIDDELVQIKAGNEREQALNDARYAADQISLAEYWSRRQQLTAAGIDAEIAALRRQRAVAAAPGIDPDNASQVIERRQQIATIDAQIAAKQTEKATQRIAIESQGAQEQIGMRERVLQIEAQIFQTQETRWAAEQAQLDEALRKYDQILTQSGVPSEEREGMVDSARRVAEAQIEFRKAKEEAEQALAEIASDTTAIMQQAEVGAITQSTATARIIALEKERIPQLDQILARMRALGIVIDDPTSEQAVRDLTNAVGGLKVEADEAGRAFKELADTFTRDIRGATKGLFKDLITDAEDWKDHLIKFLDNIADAFASVAAEIATQALFGNAGGGSGGGGFNWGGLVAGLVGALMGGAGGGDYFGSTPGAGAGGTQHSIILHGGGKVGGGGGRQVATGDWAIAPSHHSGIRSVATAGRELRPDERRAILQVGERVVSRDQAMQEDGPFGGRSGGITNIWNVQATDAGSFRRGQRQMTRLAQKAINAVGMG